MRILKYLFSRKYRKAYSRELTMRLVESEERCKEIISRNN